MRTTNGIIEIDGDRIPVTPDLEHEYTLTTAQVAKGYGISESQIRHHKKEHADELIEGEHFIISVGKTNADRKGQNLKKILYTKLGVSTLGFFIKSERAKKFRKYAAKLVVAENSAAPAPTSDSKLSDHAALIAALEATTASIRRGESMTRALSILSPALPFGVLSKFNNKPRTRLVPAYYSSRWQPDETTREFLLLNGFQLDFIPTLIPIEDSKGDVT